MKKNLKPILKAALGGLALSIASLLIWLSVNYKNDGFAAGKVIQINEKSITINDPYDPEITILITEQTLIKKNKETITPEQILLHDFAQVSGKPIDEKTIEAEKIKILKPPRKR